MSDPHRFRCHRLSARRGRLLVECLVALLLAASAAMLLVSVSDTAAALADRARQFDVAEQGAWRGAAIAFQSPCGATPSDIEWLASARHRSRTALADGAVRVATITDSWQAIGLGAHARQSHVTSVAVRCD